MTDRFVAELIAATGAACLLVGVAVIYWPAALITAGLLLLTLVVVAVVTDTGDVPAPGPPGAGTTSADTDSIRTTRLTRKG